MQGSLKTKRPKQQRDGTWIIRGTLDGRPVKFDTSLTPLGPWCASTNGALARDTIGASGATEVEPYVASYLWERARDVERDHIRKALAAAERAGYSEKRLAHMRHMLNHNDGRARPWEIVQVTGTTSEVVKGKRVRRPVTRCVRCGSSLVLALAAYRKLLASNRHTFIRKAPA